MVKSDELPSDLKPSAPPLEATEPSCMPYQSSDHPPQHYDPYYSYSPPPPQHYSSQPYMYPQLYPQTSYIVPYDPAFQPQPPVGYQSMPPAGFHLVEHIPETRRDSQPDIKHATYDENQIVEVPATDLTILENQIEAVVETRAQKRKRVRKKRVKRAKKVGKYLLIGSAVIILVPVALMTGVMIF